MRNIGVSLIDQATGNEIQSWDALPRKISFNGEDRVGAIVGAEIGGSALLVERYLDVEPPFGNPPVLSESVSYDGQKTIVTRAYASPDYASIRSKLIAKVKATAGDIILDYCPQYKQANLTAQAAELALTFPGSKGEELPEPYMTAWRDGQAIWAKIKAVRAHSNTLETEIMGLPDAQLATWQQHDWPVL